MDDSKITDYINTITEQLFGLGREIAQIRASVNVLRFVLAGELNRDHPETVLALFRQLEQKFLDSDLGEQQRKEVAEMMDAVKLSKKHGGPHEA